MIKAMKHKPEYAEGPEAWTRFQNSLKHVLAVPHEQIQRRIQKEKALSPHKRNLKLKP
jgi:hypothetical protein